METVNEEAVKQVIVDKFGEAYKNEIMVEVGGYCFYMNMLFRGDDFGGDRRRLMDTGSFERRKNELLDYTEKLKAVAELFSRYRVRQEDIVGVGLYGSVLNVALSHGKVTSDRGVVSWPVARVLVFDSFQKSGESYYMKGEGDLEEFGIKTINDGMESTVLLLGIEQVVSGGERLEKVEIDQVANRLNRWGKRTMGDSEKLAEFVSKYCDKVRGSVVNLEKPDENELEKAVLLLLSQMEMIDYSEKYGDGGTALDVEEGEETTNYSRLFEYVINGIQDYIGAVDRFKNDSKTMEVVKKVRPTWCLIEKLLADGEKVYVLEKEALSIVPGLYLLIQWMSEFYASNVEMRRSDLANYLKNIVILKGENDLLEPQIGKEKHVVMGLSTDYNDADTPEAAKLKMKFGDGLTIIDLFMEEIRRVGVNGWEVEKAVRN